MSLLIFVLLFPQLAAATKAEHAEAVSSCENLPGVWTGFLGTKPLYDEYELVWADAQKLLFSAVVVGGQTGWTLGQGSLANGNATASIAFDTGVALTGSVSEDCSVLMWSNNSTWKKTSGIDTVHVVAMNHLDVGYNGIPQLGLVNNILNRYFSLYFPRAVAISQALRDLQREEGLVYTTHAWLLHMYMHCPSNYTLSGVLLQCPSADAVDQMARAIRRGDVVWHAGAFNTEYENCYDEANVEVQLLWAKLLADEFGVPRPVTVSVRDVPGITRAVLPTFKRNGVVAVSVGVNNGSPAPAMPNPGVWRDTSTGTDMLYMQTGQKQGYPNTPGSSPTDPGGMGRDSCVQWPGLKHVLCWAFRTDNHGPPESVEEVIGQFDIARWQFPGAKVVASTFDKFVEHLQSVQAELPVVTSEVGDTWITSTTADPTKLKFYRVAAKAYTQCVEQGLCDPRSSDARLLAFLRQLTKIPEHTYGVPSIKDTANYTNQQFQAALLSQQQPEVDALHSYQEQRDMVMGYGMAQLADHPLAANISRAWKEKIPQFPDLTGFSRIEPSQVLYFQTGAGEVALQVDQTGALSRYTVGHTVWADSSHPLARYTFNTFNTSDYDKQAGVCCWSDGGTRQKVARPLSQVFEGRLGGLWVKGSVSEPAAVLVRGSVPVEAYRNYGGCEAFTTMYTVSTSTGAVSVDFQLFNCSVSRLGGAHMLHFSPVPKDGCVWMVDKLGSWVDPLDVVEKGSQYQHAVKSGVRYSGSFSQKFPQKDEEPHAGQN